MACGWGAPSRRKRSSSCESCCAKPAKVSLSLPICFFSLAGSKTLRARSAQTVRMRLANSVAIRPLDCALLLMSCPVIFMKTLLSSKVWLRHWMHAFM